MDLYDRAQNLKETVNKYIALQKSYKSDRDKSIDKSTRLEENDRLFRNSKVIYQKYVDFLYDDSFGEIEDLINSALSYVMYDKEYTVKIDLTEAHKKSIKFRIFDGENEINIKTAGKGVKSIISFCFSYYFLVKLNLYRLLAYDETLSAIGAQYRERFFDFIRNVAKEDGIIIVLTTHDVSVMNYSDVSIELNDGVIRKAYNG